MLKVGDTVTVVESKELISMKLGELSGREAVVTSILKKDNNIKGVYLVPMSGRFKRQEWFIPIQSIKSKAMIDRIRSEQILEKAKL